MLHLVLHSKQQLELAQVDRSATKLGSQSHLYLNPHIARLRVIDETHVRFELANPVHVTIHSPDDHQQQSEMVFKSFVLQIPEQEVLRLMELQERPYFVFDEISEKRILAFSEDVESGKNLDAQIKYFSNALQLPQLRSLQGLRIYLPIEDIGTPEGSYGRIMVIGKLEGYLNWFTQTPPTIPIERPLDRVYKTFSRHHSTISTYLLGLLKMDMRRHRLQRLGWLAPLTPKKKSLDVETPQNENVVPLRTRLECVELF